MRTMAAKWAIPVACLMLVSVACSPAQHPDGANNTNNGNGDAMYQEEASDYGSRFVGNQDGTRRYGVRNDIDRVGRGQNEIGFVSYNPGNQRAGDRGAVNGPDIYVDRNALANHIGYLVTSYPQIENATVLVTDDHVFIGVNDTQGKKLDPKTVKEVRRNALAVTPRYYKVHVTDDDTLNRQISEIGDRVGNGGNLADYRDDLNQLLKKLGDDTPVRTNVRDDDTTTRPGDMTD